MLEKCRLESILQRSTAQRSPKLFTTPPTSETLFPPLVFADSFRQIGLAVYLGFCSRIHEREQSVRDVERLRERGQKGGWAFTHGRKRQARRMKRACEVKKDSRMREVEARREGWIVVTVRDCREKKNRIRRGTFAGKGRVAW